MVLPEYYSGNGTGQYSPETWLDEVVDSATKEVIQEGTPLDAEHFNHMEQGIHNNSLMLAVLLESVAENARQMASTIGEEISVDLTNSKDFYFNNSVKTVALSTMRSTTDYRVEVEVQGNVTNVGDIVVYDKQMNGFKIAYTGSAVSVTVKCFVSGGAA